MTKEQIQQAAEKEYPIDISMSVLARNLQRMRRNTWVAGATSPAAKAYNGQGWVELDEKLPDDGESVWFYTPKFKKVLPGHFVKQDSFNRENVFISSDGGYYESLIVSHYMINRFPSPPNTEK